ncbi:MAG: hypothetical protein NXH82_15290 [Rhodobacteraceae bacterium]|nr:hypothetical protein [Paracoccaceae bacterium]
MPLLAWCIAIACALPASLWADAERWRLLTPDDPLYSEGMPGVAIETDDAMAVLNYLPEMAGWLATVAFGTETPVDTVTSRLISGDGSSASVQLGPDGLITRYDAETGTALIRFPVAEPDVARFRAAVTWQVVTAAQVVTVPLDGSNAALARLLDGIGPPDG